MISFPHEFNEVDIQNLTGADLAFIGDAYYELIIRDYVLHQGLTKLGKLHDACVQYVSRSSQYKIITSIEKELTEEERNIYLRGRNYHYKTKSKEYIHASGFEAVIGYLYLLHRQERLDTMIRKAIQIIEQTKENS